MRHTGLLQRHRVCLLLTVTLIMIISIAIFNGMSSPSPPFNIPRTYMYDPVPTRRDLARKILKIQRQIEFQSGFDNKVDAAWAEGLMAIVSELDPRVKRPEKQNTIQNQMMNLNGSPSPSETELPNVCPEMYKGRASDATFQHNFQEVQCVSKNFKDVLTVIIVARGWDQPRLEFVIKSYREHYDNDIMVLAFGNLPSSLQIPRVVIHNFGTKDSEALALNQVISNIETPYVFLVHSLMHFNDQSPLERLVRVIDDVDDIAVSTGAYRDIDGYWNHGCLQARAENYELVYTRGYEHSFLECMFCDDALGPFVTKTDFLKKVPMTDKLNGPALYHDWYLNVRLTGKLVVACPDVMFFIDKESKPSEKDWRVIAKQWSLQQIRSFDGKHFEISCKDAQISCSNLKKTVSSYLLPPCCRKKLREDLRNVQECAHELGLYYELQAGTLLGAVKMDGILPWDYDLDVITDCKDQQTWLTKGWECLAKKGCSSKHYVNSYWMATCKTTFIDIMCRDNRTINLPALYRSVPTKAIYDGEWIHVTSNPGKIVRNEYGPEYLRHAVHWRHVAKENSTDTRKDEVPEVTGSWNNCEEPSFHACLDHFPVDGNLRFKSNIGGLQ